MTTAAAPPRTPRWGLHVPSVQKALKFIKSKGAVTAEQLVEWDARHGRRLFSWDEAHAATEWRLQEARTFLNSFRTKFKGMRVRAFIHLREDAEQGIEHDAYYSVETIAAHPGMREQVIADISRRMAALASELPMWKLSDVEMQALLARLAEAMAPPEVA